MQDIQLPLSRETRQRGLMPENILGRRPEPFRNRNHLHGTLGKGKQREILFQHKQGELMLPGLRRKCADQGKKILRDPRLPALDDGSRNPNFHAGSPSRKASSRATRSTF